MSYRRLTESEERAFVEEFTAYQRWRIYASYASDLYGAAAERIEVVAGLESGDELRYLVIASVEVFDAQGRLLEPDLSTDWWRTKLSDTLVARADGLAGEHRSDWLDDEDDREDWLADAIGERRAALPVPAGGYDSFRLSRPPKRRHRNIYAPE
ncbi:MAG TPA: hypothetical protein VFU22_21150 [Roseiflexaceae bacterium]|nr:hypothetical protein [Roseiflexaceae bacterium]